MEFGYETALPVLVSRYVVNRACLEVTVIRLIVKLLCQCLCEVRSESSLLGRFGGDSDWIDSETASPVLVSGYIVNQACLVNRKLLLGVLVTGCVIKLASQLIPMESVVKLLCQCLCQGT